MSVKSYLQALLNTRTTPLEASEASMPNASNYVEIAVGNSDPDNFSTLAEYSAPYDGYLAAYAQGSSTSASMLLRRKGGTNFGCNATAAFDGNIMCTYLPMQKGAGARLEGQALYNISLKFIASVSGGG